MQIPERNSSGSSSWLQVLEVIIDENLAFKAHICKITVAKQAKQRIHFMIKLKRMGVQSEKLKLFYLSNIRSVKTYAVPCYMSF